MSHKLRLRALGLALVAAGAIGSAAAPAAQAAGAFETVGFVTATVTGEQIAGTLTGGASARHRIVTAAGVLECKTVKFHGKLAGISQTLTLTPTFTGCTLGGLEAMVTPKGCDYELIAGDTVDPKSSDAIYVETRISCEATEEPDEIYVHVPKTECEIEIPAQGLKPVGVAENTTTAMPKMDVDLTIDSKNMVYTVNNGTDCPNEPEDGVHNDGTYEGLTTLRAEEGLNSVGLRVT